MNYIAYKNIDGTITSGFKVKLYDIVTLNSGYWKYKLANIHTKKPSTIFTDNTRQIYKYEII